jgi:glucosamine-6-phosphate deaminase
LELVIAQDRIGLGSYAGRVAGETLRAALQQRPTARLVVATGSSQFEVLEALIREQGIDWSRVEAFHLDEYIGLSIDHPASFCGYLKQRFVERVPLKSFMYLDGIQEPYNMCQQAATAIWAAPVDLALVGIGENGHLAFNDPPADFLTTDAFRIVELDDASRRQQVGEGWFDHLDHVPRRAMSMTVHQIMQSQKIICSVPDRRKSTAVFNSIEGVVTPQVPASILQTHPNVTMILDLGSASSLSVQLQSAAIKLD